MRFPMKKKMKKFPKHKKKQKGCKGEKKGEKKTRGRTGGKEKSSPTLCCRYALRLRDNSSLVGIGVYPPH